MSSFRTIPPVYMVISNGVSGVFNRDDINRIGVPDVLVTVPGEGKDDSVNSVIEKIKAAKINCRTLLVYEVVASSLNGI